MSDMNKLKRSFSVYAGSVGGLQPRSSVPEMFAMGEKKITCPQGQLPIRRRHWADYAAGFASSVETRKLILPSNTVIQN